MIIIHVNRLFLSYWSFLAVGGVILPFWWIYDKDDLDDQWSIVMWYQRWSNQFDSTVDNMYNTLDLKQNWKPLITGRRTDTTSFISVLSTIPLLLLVWITITTIIIIVVVIIVIVVIMVIIVVVLVRLSCRPSTSGCGALNPAHFTMK